MRLTLEIAVETPDEAVAAVAAGADRLEVCAGLAVGGLTPSLGVFTRVRELAVVPLHVLLRPRAGGFHYSADEIESLVRDTELFLEAGAEGLVVGALDETGQISEEFCRRIVETARGRVTFHRAFDFTPDLVTALETLVALGFERVLTSGGRMTALEGGSRIAELAVAARGRIAVMPGGGIRPDNVAAVLQATGCKQIHTSARRPRMDPGVAWNPLLATSMGADLECRAAVLDPDVVSTLRRALDAHLP